MDKVLIYTWRTKNEVLSVTYKDIMIGINDECLFGAKIGNSQPIYRKIEMPPDLNEKKPFLKKFMNKLIETEVLTETSILHILGVMTCS